MSTLSGLFLHPEPSLRSEWLSVLLVRILLKKAPKKALMPYGLWFCSSYLLYLSPPLLAFREC
jgi:hypothetical protein